MKLLLSIHISGLFCFLIPDPNDSILSPSMLRMCTADFLLIPYPKAMDAQLAQGKSTYDVDPILYDYGTEWGLIFG